MTAQQQIDNLKAGDKFKSTDFLGWIYIQEINSEFVNLKLEHVSGSDYYETIEFNEFKVKKMCGGFNTFIR